MRSIYKFEYKYEDIPIYILLIYPVLPVAFAIHMVCEYGINVLTDNDILVVLIPLLITGLCTIVLLIVLRNIIGEVSQKHLEDKGLITKKSKDNI
jgi:hypothetical protein